MSAARALRPSDQPVARARRDGDDVLDGAAHLHADRIAARVDAEQRRVQRGLHDARGDHADRSDHDVGRQARRDLAREARTREQPRGARPATRAARRVTTSDMSARVATSIPLDATTSTASGPSAGATRAHDRTAGAPTAARARRARASPHGLVRVERGAQPRAAAARRAGTACSRGRAGWPRPPRARAPTSRRRARAARVARPAPSPRRRRRRPRSSYRRPARVGRRRGLGRRRPGREDARDRGGEARRQREDARKGRQRGRQDERRRRVSPPSSAGVGRGVGCGPGPGPRAARAWWWRGSARSSSRASSDTRRQDRAEGRPRAGRAAAGSGCRRPSSESVPVATRIATTPAPSSSDSAMMRDDPAADPRLRVRRLGVREPADVGVMRVRAAALASAVAMGGARWVCTAGSDGSVPMGVCAGAVTGPRRARRCRAGGLQHVRWPTRS